MVKIKGVWKVNNRREGACGRGVGEVWERCGEGGGCLLTESPKAVLVLFRSLLLSLSSLVSSSNIVCVSASLAVRSPFSCSNLRQTYNGFHKLNSYRL